MTHHASELRVADLMTRSVHTLRPSQCLPLAESMMGLHHVRHLPVVDDANHVVGLVTHRDLLSAKISSLAPLSDDERSSLQLSVPVSRVMRTVVWTIAPDAFAIAAARIMREERVGCLPVVADGTLVGILTEADLLALVTDALSLDRPARAWTIERVMTRVPITITPETTLADARAAMSRYGIHHLPVVAHGAAVSVVDDRALAVAEAIFEEHARTPAAHVARLLGAARVHRVAPDADVDEVAREMFRDRVDFVLVVDRGDLVGIFTSLDACRILSDRARQP